MANPTAEIKGLGKQFENAAGDAFHKVEDIATEAVTKVKDVAGEVIDSTQQAIENTPKLIRKYPFEAMLVGVGVGFLLGALVRRT